MISESIKELTRLLYSKNKETIKETIKVDLKSSAECKKEVKSYYNSDCHYPVSNETYDEAIGILDSLGTTFDKYVGICGSGTPSLYLLGKINKRRDIDIHLIDIDVRQLYNFLDIVKIYNITKNDEEYANGIRRHAKKHRCEERYGYNYPDFLSYMPNMERPEFDRDVMINLEHEKIEKFLSDIKGRGKYFIYLSNAVLDDKWNGHDETRKILSAIISNENLKDGSVIFITCGGKYNRYRLVDALLLEKNGKKLRPVKGRVPASCKIIYRETQHLGPIYNEILGD